MTTPPAIAPVSPTRRRIVALLAVLAFLVVPFVAGYEVGSDHGSSSASPGQVTSPFGPGANGPSSSSDVPSDSSGSSATPRSTGRIDVDSVADAVDDSVVNVRVSYEDGAGEAAGTGIVISSSGLVLTNNHVIKDADTVTVEISTTGEDKPAKVLGYSLVNDVALLQIEGASGLGLKAADLGNSSSLALGDPVVALGNAGGHGGEPTVVSGSVTALDQQITASDADGTNVQTLQGLIQVDADIRSGDSGGPLADANGTVVGMNAAASVNNGNGGFRFGDSANEGYAIPIEDALAIAKKISAGTSTADIHVGDKRAVLGVQIQVDSATSRRVPQGSATASGAPVVGVDSSSGAGKAGIEAGDTITAIDGRTVTSGSDLTRALVRYSPGDSVEVTWTDASGSTHRESVKLGSGPPA